MRRKLAFGPDGAVWKHQVERVATAFDLLAVAAGASAHLNHLTGATPAAATDATSLAHVGETLSTLAASPDFDPTAVTATLLQVLRETRAAVDDTRRLLKHPAATETGPLGDASFLLRDFVPRMERAYSALERLHAQVPLSPRTRTRPAGPSSVQTPPLIPPGRTGRTPPPAPRG